jgi:hypothetical protein
MESSKWFREEEIRKAVRFDDASRNEFGVDDDSHTTTTMTTTTTRNRQQHGE